MPSKATFYSVLTDAINDLAEHGYDSAERVAQWTEAIREAANAMLVSPRAMDRMLREGLVSIYKRMVDNGEIVKYHPGIPRFTIDRLKHSMRSELDRRLMASADLINLNREASVQRTIQRFQGWATSIPKGGSDAVRKTETKKELRKALASLPFEERRVIIDQGHKLVASISEIIANDGGALAGVWHSNWRQRNYNYREDHKERDGEVYVLRGNWALRAGLMKAGRAGYYDKITSVGEEVFCRCYMIFLYHLRSLPTDMITERGRQKLKEAQEAIAS
jgi:hypothetical protein